jgi:hypothetical protein
MPETRRFFAIRRTSGRRLVPIRVKGKETAFETRSAPPLTDRVSPIARS